MHYLDLTTDQLNFIDTYCITNDFPIEGVRFLDIFPFLEKYPINLQRYFHTTDSIVLMPEARGFLFYDQLGPKNVIPLRKNGKLPGNLVAIQTKKEYGLDTLYFQEDALKRHIDRYVSTHPYATVIPIMFFDDVAATGQTAECICKFFMDYRFMDYTFRIVSCIFLFELKDLGAKKRIEDLGISFESIYSY